MSAYFIDVSVCNGNGNHLLNRPHFHTVCFFSNEHFIIEYLSLQAQLLSASTALVTPCAPQLPFESPRILIDFTLASLPKKPFLILTPCCRPLLFLSDSYILLIPLRLAFFLLDIFPAMLFLLLLMCRQCFFPIFGRVFLPLSLDSNLFPFNFGPIPDTSKPKKDRRPLWNENTKWNGSKWMGWRNERDAEKKTVSKKNAAAEEHPSHIHWNYGSFKLHSAASSASYRSKFHILSLANSRFQTFFFETNDVFFLFPHLLDGFFITLYTFLPVFCPQI